MNNPNVKSKNFYWMKLKKQISKAGKAYYTGNFAYAVDVVGFEKEDGSITLWLAPKDMDEMKKKSQQRQPQQQNYQTPSAPMLPQPQPPRVYTPRPPPQQPQQQEEAPPYDWGPDLPDDL